MADDPAIRVERLGKVYPLSRGLRTTLGLLWRGAPSVEGGKLALDDVSFSVERGASWGVVGRNGSGKTTLLRLIAGALEPSSGRVAVEGRVAALLDLGAGIDPEFTGRENALLLGVLAGAERRAMAQRLDAVAEFSGLGSAFEQPVRSYSAGMSLRLAFSAAVHADPEVLLIDEVLAVGDAFFQQRCMRYIRELQHRGCTVLLVTHDPSAVFRFCDRALWLEHGRVAAVGDPSRVVNGYLGARYRDAAVLDELPEPSARAADLDADGLAPAARLPHVDHRYGDGAARVLGIDARDEYERPLDAPLPGQMVRVVITVAAVEPLRSPIIGFNLRNRLGEIITATNSSYEGRPLPPLAPGDCVSVEFAFRWPSFVSGMFSFSPSVADGTLDRHNMNDWIDNALVTESTNPDARYGWFRLEEVGVRARLQRVLPS
jgi:ABC-type polysaccharide/polyol phosphate transport system ATPase subunit